MLLWEADTGRQVRSFPGATCPVAFVDGGKQVLTGTQDKGPHYFQPLALWDAATGKQVGSIAANPAMQAVVRLPVSPDGSRLLAYAKDVAAVWDVRTGQQVCKLLKGEGTFTSAAFSPDGKYVLTGNNSQHKAFLWDAATGAKVRTFEGAPRKKTSYAWKTFRVGFSPDGQHVLGGPDGEGKVRLWEAGTGQVRYTFADQVDGPVEFTPDGKQVLTQGKDKRLVLWDVAIGAKVREIGPGKAPFRAAAFRKDGVLLACSDGTIYDPVTGQVVRKLQGNVGRPWGLAVSPDGSRVATQLASDVAVVWEPLAEGAPRLLRRDIKRSIPWLAFSPDGKQLLAGDARPANDFGFGGDHSAVVWDVGTALPVRTLAGHQNRIDRVAWSPDGKHLATGGWDGKAVVWDAATGTALRDLPGHDVGVTALVWSPDSKHVLTVDFRNKATLWDAASGAKVRAFERLLGSRSLAFSPDGKLVATGEWFSSGGSIYETSAASLWNPQTDMLVRTLRGHTRAVTAVAFSPDGQLLVTGSRDRTAIVWEVGTGKRLRTFAGHDLGLTGVAFGADGRHVVTASEDGTLRLWDFATGDEAGRLLVSADGRDWLVVTPEGFHDGNGRELCAIRVGQGLTVMPLDQNNHRPGLLSSIWAGRRPLRGRAP